MCSTYKILNYTLRKLKSKKHWRNGSDSKMDLNCTPTLLPYCLWDINSFLNSNKRGEEETAATISCDNAFASFADCGVTERTMPWVTWFGTSIAWASARSQYSGVLGCSVSSGWQVIPSMWLRFSSLRKDNWLFLYFWPTGVEEEKLIDSKSTS